MKCPHCLQNHASGTVICPITGERIPAEINIQNYTSTNDGFWFFTGAIGILLVVAGILLLDSFQLPQGIAFWNRQDTATVAVSQFSGSSSGNQGKNPTQTPFSSSSGSGNSSSSGGQVFPTNTFPPRNTPAPIPTLTPTKIPYTPYQDATNIFNLLIAQLYSISFQFIAYSHDDNDTQGVVEFDQENVYVRREGADEEDKTRMSDEGRSRNAVWSPDGRYLAFSQFGSDNWDSGWIIIHDFRNQLEWIIEGDFIPNYLSWSPDGKKIAFSDIKYDHVAILNVETEQVEIIDQDGHWVDGPTWSMDGNFLAYVQTLGAETDNTDAWVLKLADLRTNRVSQITTINDGIGISRDHNNILWSAIDNLLIYERFEVSDAGRKNIQLWVLDPFSLETYRLKEPTFVAHQMYFPWIRYWSPNPDEMAWTQPVDFNQIKNANTETAVFSLITNEKDQAPLVFVEQGQFIMGVDPEGRSPEEHPNFSGPEYPEKVIQLDSYWIYQTEVTNLMYQMCVEDNYCDPPIQTSSYLSDTYYGNPNYDDYPVVNVEWRQAATYCDWAGGRLPTEAQWEKAARGPNGNKYPWGNEDPADFQTNLCDSNCTYFTNSSFIMDWINDGHDGPAPVGTYPGGTSYYNAYELSGNVWEWVFDWFQVSYSRLPLENPTGPANGSRKVIRGGSFINNIEDVRSLTRESWNPQNATTAIGFRCVINP